MRKLLIALTLLAPAIAMAADSSQINDMQQKCEKERTSMFRSNNGTPTCDRLDKIHSDYDSHTQEITKDLRSKCEREQGSIFKENDGTPSCVRLDKKLQDRADQPVGNGFRYSKERGKNCYFNDAGQIQSCP